MSTRKRDLDFIRAAEARRALDRRACAVGLSGAGLRVWLVISDYTLGYCRTSEPITHGLLAEVTGLTRRSVSRALAEVAEAGLIRYQAGLGDPKQGRNAFSRVTINMPVAETGGDDSAVPSRDDEMVPSPQGETTGLSGGRGRNGQGGDDHMVPSRDDEMVRGETTGLSTNRERTSREDSSERGQPGEGNRGVVASVTKVQTAREWETATPTPVVVHAEEPASELVLLASHAEDEQEQEEDPGPVTRRVGGATGAQAVARFEAESGTVLAKRVGEALAKSLDEVAEKVSPNELLMGLGFWHEYRGGKFPQDAAERVGEAMAAEALPIDPCNAMTPGDAVQEGRCRARMASLPRADREVLARDPMARISGYGLPWPTPNNVRGLLPAPTPGAGVDVEEALRTAMAQPRAWDRITASMSRLAEAIEAAVI